MLCIHARESFVRPRKQFCRCSLLTVLIPKIYDVFSFGE